MLTRCAVLCFAQSNSPHHSTLTSLTYKLTMEVDEFSSPNRKSGRQLLLTSPSSNRMQNKPRGDHRALYKTPPRWFSNYQLTLRRQRKQANLVDKFRKISDEEENNADINSDGIVQKVMQQVWKEMMVEPEWLSVATDFQLESELQAFEQELKQREFIYWDKFDQEAITWALENQFSTVCFVCMKANLVLSPTGKHTKVHCPYCSFNFIAKAVVTEERLYHMVNQLIDLHDSKCNSKIVIDVCNNMFNSDVNISFICSVGVI